MAVQLGLYDVLALYDDDPLSNTALYERILDVFPVSESELSAQSIVDRHGNKASVAKRKVRWHQQALKQAGLLERVGPSEWRRTGKKKEFSQLIGRQVVLAFNTDLGCAIWGDVSATAEIIDQPIHLYLSSPPYPLANPRSYGNVQVHEYVEWLVDAVKPIVPKLARGGAVVLNCSNDIFVKGSPRRSSYLSRLVVELEEKLELYLMDTVIWSSNKAPGPTHWAQRNTVQLYGRYEPLLWLTNDPDSVFSDNTRISAPGLPGNVWEISNTCHENRLLRQQTADLGAPVHDAMFPLGLVRRAIEFWTEPGQLVVDLMSGTAGVGYEAERLGRHWIVGEQNAQSLLSGALRWAGSPSIETNPQFLKACA